MNSFPSGLVRFASAAGDAIKNSANGACNGVCGNGDITVIFHNIVNALIFLVGAISVIMIIIGGLRYVISNGDPKQAEVGRNTILYAVIGVIISITSYAIVNFVASRF